MLYLQAMRYLIIIVLFNVACSPQFHINKAKRQTQKAIDKGAVITHRADTIRDTIIEVIEYTKNDTVFIEITKTIERVVTKKGEVRYITRKDKRREYRKEKKESKRDFKLSIQDKKIERTEAKAKNKNRSWWIVVFSILILLLIYIYFEANKKINRYGK